MPKKPRIGVYICHCGGNISNTVDVAKVKEAISQLEGVAVVETYEYTCSNPGQEMIKTGIKEHKLDRVIVASCSPRMHMETFRRTVASAGLNPYLFEMANIREQCSWIHSDKEVATQKAIDLIRGAVERARYLDPLKVESVKVNTDVLVIGGGIAGIIASLDLADKGFKVYLIEKSPSIGGHMAQLSKTFPTLDCSQCILSPKMVEVMQHPNIKLITLAEVAAVEGSPGNYRVLVEKKPRYVDESKCTGCGKCSEVCPVTLPNEFEIGLGTRKAIYKPFPQAVPPAFLIDKRGVPPCKAACPAGVNVQGYVALIRQGKLKEALELIRERIPLPAVCGRVCPAPCEEECERGKVDDPLAIRALKRFVTDHVYTAEMEKPTPIPKIYKKKVAIIGSGPAGLTAAYELVKKGYPVTVFESSPEPGGMLRTAIPEYRLPKSVLAKEIEYLTDLGVEIVTNTTIGKDLTIKDLLRKGYEAVFLAIGAHKSRELGIEGENLKGVIHALHFLKEVNLGNKVKIGDKVAVIGGGNVAVDAARVAHRLGAKEVLILYRRSRAEMPAFPSEVKEAEEEGIKIHFLTSPKRILDKDGHVAGLECVKMGLGEPDETGRRRPIPIEGSEHTIEADTVILAIGESADTSHLPKEIEITERNTIKADPVTLETSLPGVFAGGDAVHEPATVIEAIASGRRASVSIDRYLRGEDLRADREEEIKKVTEVPKEGVEKKPRQNMPLLSPDQRATFNEIELGFTEEMAMNEANRCLSCGGCSECRECEKVCASKETILHQQKGEFLELDVGAIVACTGFEQIDPKVEEEYSFGIHPDVVTNLQLERLMGREMKRPSDGKVAKKIAFILCVGSRMSGREGGVEHCCKIGCMAAIKQAMLVQKVVPDAEPWIFYTDIRADGKGYEEFYATARNHHVKFIRGRVAFVTPLGDKLLVKAEDTILGMPVEQEFDLVVLCLGIVPSFGTKDLARKLGIQVGSDGFLLERHFKLRPVDSQREGIFVAGCAVGPKDIRETTLEAMATASRVAAFLGKGEISVSPEVAYIIPEKCDLCGICVEVCPVKAVEKASKAMKINPISCVGCGICVPKCPREAIELNYSTDAQLLAQIRGVAQSGIKPKILAFLEKEIAYGSADLAGQSRASYIPNVEIIRVPTTGRVGLKHVLYAFAMGADGVILIEDHGGVFTEEALRQHVTELKKNLGAYGVESLRLMSFTTTLPEYNKVINVFETLSSRVLKMGPLSDEKRLKIKEKLGVKE